MSENTTSACCGTDKKCCQGYGKLIYKVLLILAVVAIVIIALLRDRIVNNPQWQIPVIGQGKIEYTPEIANINMGVQIDKVAKADEALNQLNGKINNIIKAVTDAGVNKEDIKTQNYTLAPQYDYINSGNANSNTLTGYNANQTVVVKIKDLKNNQDKIAKVIAAATKAGVNQIAGVTFEAADANALKQEARLKAIADARGKAQEIAKSLDVDLGDIIGMWENMISSPEPIDAYKMGMGGGNAASPIVPSGKQEMVIEVNVNYQID